MSGISEQNKSFSTKNAPSQTARTIISSRMGPLYSLKQINEKHLIWELRLGQIPLSLWKQKRFIAPSTQRSAPRKQRILQKSQEAEEIPFWHFRHRYKVLTLARIMLSVSHIPTHFRLLYILKMICIYHSFV